MPNMRPKQQLERISRELEKVLGFINTYHGVSPDEAMALDREATGICETAAEIAAQARAALGNKSERNLRKKVRKALGYTVP